MTLPSAPRYRITERRLVHVDSRTARHLQKREPCIPRPRVPGPVVWLTLPLIPLVLVGAAMGWWDPSAPSQWALLPLFFLWWLADLWLIRRWIRLRRSHRSARTCGGEGRFEVLFDRARKTVTVRGPLEGQGEMDGEPPVSPVAAQLPLDRVSLKEGRGPVDPWSDLDHGPDEMIALSLCYVIERPEIPDLEGPFDLLEDLTPDLRWYVTIHHPEVPGRLAAARSLLSGVD